MKIQRGFKALHRVIKENKGRIRNIRSCTTCKYFYSDKSKEEFCHNSNVTPFDTVSEGGKEYCTFWTPSWISDTE